VGVGCSPNLGRSGLHCANEFPELQTSAETAIDNQKRTPSSGIPFQEFARLSVPNSFLKTVKFFF